jgi:hypothetical protein
MRPMGPQPLSDDDLEWLRKFVAARKWQRGKADPSHEYTIRNWMPDGEHEFERAVTMVREFGEPAEFWSKTYIYLTVDGMKYWTMGELLRVTEVFNRAVS